MKKIVLFMRRESLRLSLVVTLILGGWALYQTAGLEYLPGNIAQAHWHLLATLVGVLIVVVTFLLLVATWFPRSARLISILEHTQQALVHFGNKNLYLYAFLVTFLLALNMLRLAYPFTADAWRFLFYWIAVLAGIALFQAAGLGWRDWQLWGASALVAAFILEMASYIPNVTTYPFTLDWSEGSRYYYASLYFARRIYGFSAPLSPVDPNRSLLQAVPFMFSNAPLWLHRFWQVLLYLNLPLVCSWLLAGRLDIKQKRNRVLFVFWGFLYLLLIAQVYYHLLVPVMLILWGFRNEKARPIERVRSMAVIVLASGWAGISRVNWFPVPAMLAISLYLIEVPINDKPLWRYWLAPLTYGLVGGISALAAHSIYIYFSGSPAGQFASSFTSNLLWYRLFPNATFPPGILLATLFVSIPLFIFTYLGLTRNWKQIHTGRLVILFGELLLLLAGGLVVSVKIGGGSNLHNLDAYFVLLLVISAMSFFNRFIADNQEIIGETHRPSWLTQLYWGGLVLAVILPVYFSLTGNGPQDFPDPKRTQHALTVLQNLVDSAGKDRDILFISERQLLAFHLIHGVRLVPEYERVSLMEMAMSKNAAYMQKFLADIKSQRFALIVSDPLYIPVKGGDKSFGAENDVWSTQVTDPILCYYKPVPDSRMLLMDVKVEALVPRPVVNCQ